MKFELPSHEPQLIGRSSEALPITDSTVSRRHAELTPDDGSWYLRDLDSANGTFVNGQRITIEAGRVRLAPGDQVRCGSTLFVFAVAPGEPGQRSSAVELLDAEAFDINVESKRGGTMSTAPRSRFTSATGSGTRRLAGDPNEDSMILATPDFAKAASDHLRVIYELTALTAAVVERDELLRRVMDLIFNEFQPDRGFILLQESAEARPEPAVVRYKVKPKTLDEGRIPVSRTIVQHTLRHGEGILSTNAMNDTRFRSGDSVQDYGIRSAICVPINHGDRTFGVIHIDSSLANFTFTEGQLDLLNAIGQHTGLAMHSVELLAERMQTERLATMGRTVASLSHSIKNILQGLRGGADAVELALKRGNLEMAREGWPIMSRNLDRIYTLTLNMLAYSKHRSLDIELGSINALIEEVVALVQRQCEERRVGIITDLADDLPPMPIDANAIHQALMNMVLNAIEAVPAKKGVVTISTRYIAEPREAEIIVADNGPGIITELQQHVFDAFVSSKGQRGTGLGLAVAKKIVEEHGGRIRLESTRTGTTFTITLPSDHDRLASSDTRLPKPIARDEMVDEFE